MISKRFHVTSPCWRESTGHCWILLTNDWWYRALMIFHLMWTSHWKNSQVASDLRCHDGHMMSLWWYNSMLVFISKNVHINRPIHNKYTDKRSSCPVNTLLLVCLQIINTYWRLSEKLISIWYLAGSLEIVHTSLLKSVAHRLDFDSLAPWGFEGNLR